MLAPLPYGTRVNVSKTITRFQHVELSREMSTFRRYRWSRTSANESNQATYLSVTLHPMKAIVVRPGKVEISGSSGQDRCRNRSKMRRSLSKLVSSVSQCTRIPVFTLSSEPREWWWQTTYTDVPHRSVRGRVNTGEPFVNWRSKYWLYWCFKWMTDDEMTIGWTCDPLIMLGVGSLLRSREPWRII